MPTIPIPPGYKPSFVDSKTKMKLVTDALMGAQANTFGGMLILETTQENRLDQIPRREIVRTLESIQKANPNLFVVLPDLSPWVNDEVVKAEMSVDHLDREFGLKWRKMLEVGAIVLDLRRGFDNWCDAQRYKKSMTVANLSLENRKKVVATVSAIFERFELTSNPTVTITWKPQIAIENAESRDLSLEFLNNKDVVKQYKFQSGGIHIDVEIDVKEFFRFCDEVRAIYTPPNNEEQAAESLKHLASNSFTAIDNLRWQEITIQFLNGHDVHISAKATTETVNFKAMGFEDARTGLPNTQWALMRILAENKGQVNWKDSEAATNIKKRKQILSDTLKAYFRIDDDPFYPYRDERAYRTKFTLKAEDA